MMQIDTRNAKYYQEGLTKQFNPLYTRINNIDRQFKQDDANREHYKLPPFAKPQIHPTDEEINKESIIMNIRNFEAEVENIHREMCTMMKANRIQYRCGQVIPWISRQL